MLALQSCLFASPDNPKRATLVHFGPPGAWPCACFGVAMLLDSMRSFIRRPNMCERRWRKCCALCAPR